MRSEYPFIKLITPGSLVGFRDDVAKKDYLHKVFTDAYKSPLSLLILGMVYLLREGSIFLFVLRLIDTKLDDLERMIEWNPVGPRFSNTILQTIVTLMRKPPPKGHRLLVLATTSQHSTLNVLDVVDAFDKEIPIPAVQDYRELHAVLSKAGMFDARDINEALNAVREYTSGSEAVGVGIKTILTTAEEAQLSGEPVQWFAQQLAAQIVKNNPM